MSPAERSKRAREEKISRHEQHAAWHFSENSDIFRAALSMSVRVAAGVRPASMPFFSGNSVATRQNTGRVSAFRPFDIEVV